MLSKLFALVGRIYSFLVMLVVAALLGVATMAAWHFYQEEHLRSQLASHGQPVTVRVERTDRSPRQVWDALGNFVYVGFTHQGRPYEVRYVADTTWVSPGDQLALHYEPQQDAFGQLLRRQPNSQDVAKSRLMRWSIVPDLTPENRALLAFGAVLVVLFFVVCGLLASLTGLRAIPAIARPVGFLALVSLAVFFTYDVVQYYQYAAELQRDGRPVEVVVQEANRRHESRRSSSRSWLSSYVYDATFLFQGQTRVVPIEEAEYDRLKAGATKLAVLYSAVRDDFIAEGYSPRWSPVVVPLFFWLLAGLALRQFFARTPVAHSAGMVPPQ